MNDSKAIEEVKERYLDNYYKIDYLESKQTTLNTLQELLNICDRTKHMEQRIEWYTDEKQPDWNNWIDVDGEGYGWIWLKGTEETWHSMLKEKLLDYIETKKEIIAERNENVVFITTENKIIYHFIERESSKCDTIYTFSDDEIDY